MNCLIITILFAGHIKGGLSVSKACKSSSNRRAEWCQKQQCGEAQREAQFPE